MRYALTSLRAIILVAVFGCCYSSGFGKKGINSKGFGGASSKGFNSPVEKGSPHLNPMKLSTSSTENLIQRRIDAQPMLSEFIDLKRQLSKFRTNKLGMSFIEQTLIPESIERDMAVKSQRLHQLVEKHGLTAQCVANAVNEITFDVTASQRNARFQSLKLPQEAENFMIDVAACALNNVMKKDNSNGQLLDVGCGTGILMSFMQKLAKENPNIYQFDESRCTGVDLSAEMLRIAKRSFPRSRFLQCDFLSMDRASSGQLFDVVAFNECLHYFCDPLEALQKAASLCAVDRPAKIIITQPRGLQNVEKLHLHNPIMVPSTLPSLGEFSELTKQLTDSFGREVHLVKETFQENPRYFAVLELMSE